MRQGFNQFSIPYMNELTANQFNAASVFGGNMPLGFIQYSMDTVARFFQDQGPMKPGDVQVLPPGSDPSRGQMPPLPPNRRMPSTIRRGGRTAADIIFGLPDYGSIGATPPTFPTQTPQGATGLKKCDDTSTFLDRLLGRCCVGEIVNGECVLVNSSKGISSEDAQKLIKSPIDTKGIIVVAVGLILLLGAIISLR